MITDEHAPHGWAVKPGLDHAMGNFQFSHFDGETPPERLTEWLDEHTKWVMEQGSRDTFWRQARLLYEQIAAMADAIEERAKPEWRVTHKELIIFNAASDYGDILISIDGDHTPWAQRPPRCTQHMGIVRDHAESRQVVSLPALWHCIDWSDVLWVLWGHWRASMTSR